MHISKQINTYIYIHTNSILYTFICSYSIYGCSVSAVARALLARLNDQTRDWAGGWRLVGWLAAWLTGCGVAEKRYIQLWSSVPRRLRKTACLESRKKIIAMKIAIKIKIKNLCTKTCWQHGCEWVCV